MLGQRLAPQGFYLSVPAGNVSNAPEAVAVGRLEGRDTYFQTWNGGSSLVPGSCLLTSPRRPALLHSWFTGLHQAACETLPKAFPQPTLARILPQSAGLRESLPAGVTGNWTSVLSAPDKKASRYRSKTSVLWNSNIPPPKTLSAHSSFHHTRAKQEQVSHGPWTLSEATREV